jgi:hypothetical protein
MVYYGLTATGIVLLIWYYIAYFRAERPMAGTLEWIDRYERPPFAPESCGKPLCRTDALWAAVAAVLAAAASLTLYAGPSGSASYERILGTLLRFELGGVSMDFCGETVCAMIAAAAAYLLGKAISGSAFAALAGALMYCVLPTEEIFSCFAFCALLFLWLWAAYPRRGFANWALLLAGALCAGAAAYSFFFAAVVLSLVLTLAVILIRRVRDGVCAGGCAFAQFAAALVMAAVGYAAAAILCRVVSVTKPETFSKLLTAIRGAIEILVGEMRALPLSDRLPAVPLVLSGLVPLFALWHNRRSGEALFLLLWALPLTLQYALVPAATPMQTAAPICALLTARLFERGHSAAARIGAIAAVVAVGIQVILWSVFPAP